MITIGDWQLLTYKGETSGQYARAVFFDGEEAVDTFFEKGSDPDKVLGNGVQPMSRWLVRVRSFVSTNGQQGRARLSVKVIDVQPAPASKDGKGATAG